MNCVSRIVTRENDFDQGEELMRRERACDQTSTCWSVGVGKEEVSGAISIPHKRAKVGLNAHHPRIQRS
jgi:hypothetical protein